MLKIKKLLIANRGEIALRIMRTAHEMNIETVAIFSEADRLSPHVKYAREAICIGPAPASESYLNIQKILAAAVGAGADAIHPGYGFLSENAAFAKQVEEAGLIFVGPSFSSIEIMGSKLAAKQAAAEYDIPLVPGTKEAIEDRDEARLIAEKIGYPVLIKASAGGGGKGMRVVTDPNDFDQQMDRAVSEALSSFGDGSVFIEKYIASPKHIEIQILGDQHGNIIHLFERECSIQRRHQKVIEEAPSISINENVRAEMGRCAVDVAKSCGYYGAGTVEFIVDQDKNFYFLEMNTRLQVEHPVTELITGIDLVKQMIWIAEGKALSYRQEDITFRGHAIESRVYAEDPANGFLPDVGTLKTYSTPKGNGVRVDDGFEQGMNIPIYYDPMIAKLISYGETREEAISKMIRAIDEYQISGVKTTLPFCRFVMQHSDFQDGSFNTNFVKEHFEPSLLNPSTDDNMLSVAAVFTAFMAEQRKNALLQNQSTQKQVISNWKRNRLGV